MRKQRVLLFFLCVSVVFLLNIQTLLATDGKPLTSIGLTYADLKEEWLEKVVMDLLTPEQQAAIHHKGKQILHGLQEKIRLNEGEMTIQCFGDYYQEKLNVRNQPEFPKKIVDEFREKILAATYRDAYIEHTREAFEPYKQPVMIKYQVGDGYLLRMRAFNNVFQVDFREAIERAVNIEFNYAVDLLALNTQLHDYCKEVTAPYKKSGYYFRY